MYNYDNTNPTEDAATEIEKALPEFHDLVEYDLDYTSNDIHTFTDRRWGIKDSTGYFAEKLFGIEAAKIIGIHITDHIICGRPNDTSPGFVSLREKTS